MKLVADTNVVLSGLLWLGNPGRLLEAAANGRVTLYTSPALITELTATLRSPKFAARIERSGLTLDELLARIKVTDLFIAILSNRAAQP